MKQVNRPLGLERWVDENQSRPIGQGGAGEDQAAALAGFRRPGDEVVPRARPSASS